MMILPHGYPCSSWQRLPGPWPWVQGMGTTEGPLRHPWVALAASLFIMDVLGRIPATIRAEALEEAVLVCPEDL